MTTSKKKNTKMDVPEKVEQINVRFLNKHTRSYYSH